jgi:hypothetical protein
MRYAFPALAALAAACLAAVPPVVPELFAEGVISTPDYELNSAFLPDGKTVYFTNSTAGMGFWTIVSSRRIHGKWTGPQVAPFSGTFSDAGLAVTPDGTRLVFLSRRPIPGNSGRPVPHTWYVARTAAGWTKPRNAAALNSDAGEYYPSAAADGTLYFESARAGGNGRADVYRSRLRKGEYAVPENLGAPLNGQFNEDDAVIAPDQSFLVLTINGRPDDTGMASPDSRYLYFTSTRGFGVTPCESPRAPLNYRGLTARLHGVLNGLGNIYRVPLAALRTPSPV